LVSCSLDGAVDWWILVPAADRSAIYGTITVIGFIG
jgi:hypothetical protein